MRNVEFGKQAVEFFFARRTVFLDNLKDCADVGLNAQPPEIEASWGR
jgi:hypothetical protein